MKYSDITSWLSGTDSVFGLEVYVNREQNKEFRLVQIHKKNGELHANSFAVYASIEELIAAIPENSPVVLVWNGKGVIHRNFSSKEESTIEIVRSLFPDIKSDDFLYQQTKTSSAGIVSLIRKDLITELLVSFEAKKITILSISIGPFRTAVFFQLLGLFPNDLMYDCYRIQTNSSGEIIEYEILPDTITESILVGGEKINGMYINAYTAACAYLLTTNGDTSYAKVEDELINIQLKKYKESILKRRGGLVFLVSILILLLINFFIFSTLRKENNRFHDQLAVSQSKLKQLDSLETFIKTKKGFLEKAGWTEKVIVSKECDKIAETVPAEIRLTELTIHPVDITESRNAKETIFANKKIIIKGVTKRVTALNDWLKIVSLRASIDGLHMEEYHFDTQLQEGQFKLEGSIE